MTDETVNAILAAAGISEPTDEQLAAASSLVSSGSEPAKKHMLISDAIKDLEKARSDLGYDAILKGVDYCDVTGVVDRLICMKPSDLP